MRYLATATATAGLLAVTAVGFAGVATAAPTASRSAADTVASLEAKGHHVQLNGSSHAPLSLCTVTGVHGLNDSNIDSTGNRIDDERFTTVYVDVDCQDG